MADEKKDDNGLADFLDDTVTIVEDDSDDNQDIQTDNISDEVDDLDDEDDADSNPSDDDDSDDGTVDGEEGDEDSSDDESEEVEDKSGAGAQEQIRILTDLVSKLTQQQLKQDTPTETVVEKADPFKSESFKNLQTILDLDDTEMAVMAGFLQEMNESTQTTAVERALELTPEVVTKHMDTKTIITTAKEKFYKTNPALVPVQEYVRLTANSIAQQNPSYSIKQVLDAAAETTYKALNITKTPSNDADKPGKRKPAFAKGTKGSRKKVDKKRSKADEIEDLFN